MPNFPVCHIHQTPAHLYCAVFTSGVMFHCGRMESKTNDEAERQKQV